MDREDLETVALVLLSSSIAKPLAILLAIIALAVLVMGGIVFWTYQLTTAIVLGAFGFLFLWFLKQIEALDVEQYPYVIFLPVILFISGFVIEKSGLEILRMQTIGLSALNPAIFTMNGSVAMFWIIIALAVGGLVLSFVKE